MDAKRATEEQPEGVVDVDRLKELGDVDGLLELARAYRNGTAAGGRDLRRCLDVYRSAAELGSADAEYAVALFALTGSVVEQDLREGATRLRSAAEKGSVAAKVYIGNLYELGIHYKADPEKADVWYRNAARGDDVASAPGTPEYAQDLAELGCVRYVLARIASGELAEEDKARLLQRARAHGYGLRLRGNDEVSIDRPTVVDALDTAEVPAATEARTVALPLAPKTPAAKPANKPAKKRTAKGSATGNVAAAIGAFGYAVLFAIAGVGGGYAATLGARELVAHGTKLPGLGTRADLVFPIVLVVVGVLPAALVYRAGAVVKAIGTGALAGAVGWGIWGFGRAFVPGRDLQTIAFALAGFLATLFVLGFAGGTKQPQPQR